MNVRRSGFTLVELLVVLVIGAIVLTSVYQTMITQQRSVRQGYAIVGTQQNVRTAIQVLSTDLREVSATDGDITAASATSISIRALRKAGVICSADAGGTWADVAQLGDAFDNDSVYVFSDGPDPTIAADDSWVRAWINNPSSAPSCLGNPVSASSRQVHFNPPVLGMAPGGLIRSFVPITYSLVDAGGKGVLTRTESGTTVNLIEDLGTIAERGLQLTYWDTTGTLLTSGTLAANLNKVARIQISVRGKMVGGQSGAQRQYVDSLFTTLQLRGNRKLR